MVRKIFSIKIFLALSIPVFLSFTLILSLGLPLNYVWQMVSYKVFYLLTFLWIFAGIIYSIFMKNYKRLLVHLIFFLIMSLCFYLYAFHFTAIISLGEGESFQKYDHVEKGPLSKIPEISIAVKEIQDDTAQIIIKNKEFAIKKGETIYYSGYIITLEDILKAPLFTLKIKDKEIDSVYAKLDLEKKKNDYFMFSILPHKFYLTIPSQRREYWKQIDSEWKKIAEDRQQGLKGDYYLLIKRGKLNIFEKEILSGEKIVFEGGHSVVISHGSKWLRLKIGTVPNFFKPIDFLLEKQ